MILSAICFLTFKLQQEYFCIGLEEPFKVEILENLWNCSCGKTSKIDSNFSNFGKKTILSEKVLDDISEPF